MNNPAFRIVGCLIFTVYATLLRAADPEDAVLSAQKAAGDWIKVRTETARLENDWRNEHALLESTVKALKERATTLEEKRDNFKARTATDRSETEEIRRKQKKEADELQAVEAQLKVLSGKLVQIREGLPPRLSAALELPYRSLASSEASSGERMQHAMSILNRCAQFNRLIEAGEEVLTVDGSAKSLEVIYWGLSHGYALDRTAKKAWLGSPVAGHWQWEALPDAADEVARLIAVYHDKADPQFVVVPAKLASASPSAH